MMINMMVDTHCHVYELDCAEEIIMRALDNDIVMILNGTDPASNIEVLKLADKYSNVYAALGYFYLFASDVCEEDIDLLDRQLKNDNVVAVGEIGLDYYQNKDNKKSQKDLFETMLGLALKHNLPAIIHCRKAMQDTFDILKEYDVRGSMHSYMGSAEMAKQFINQGFYIGVSGTITHTNNKKTKRLVKSIDISNILVETDSPYMTPSQKIGKVNTSLNLKYIIDGISQELGINSSVVRDITTNNAKDLFSI